MRDTILVKVTPFTVSGTVTSNAGAAAIPRLKIEFIFALMSASNSDGTVTPFEKFARNNSKNQLVIKLSLKAIENPLLLYIEFEENSEYVFLAFG